MWFLFSARATARAFCLAFRRVGNLLPFAAAEIARSLPGSWDCWRFPQLRGLSLLGSQHVLLNLRCLPQCPAGRSFRSAVGVFNSACVGVARWDILAQARACTFCHTFFDAAPCCVRGAHLLDCRSYFRMIPDKNILNVIERLRCEIVPGIGSFAQPGT